MVLPENIAIWRSRLDIGLTTISSVSNTPSTTTPNVWLPTCITTTKPLSDCGDRVRRCRIAFLLRDGAGPFRQRGVVVALLAAVEFRERAVIPIDAQCFASQLRGPKTIRNDCSAAIDFSYTPSPRCRSVFVAR